MGTTHPLRPRGRWPLARCFREADDGGPRPLTIGDDTWVTLLLDCQKAGHAVTRVVVEEGRRETMAVLKALEGRVRCPGGGQEVGGLVNFTASREA